MLKWLKRKLGIFDLLAKYHTLENEIKSHRIFVTKEMERLREFTRVDADIGMRGNNTVILTGVYRNKAYVQFYDLGDSEFVHLADMLKDMKRYALVRHIDAPMSFRAVFKI